MNQKDEKPPAVEFAENARGAIAFKRYNQTAENLPLVFLHGITASVSNKLHRQMLLKLRNKQYEILQAL